MRKNIINGLLILGLFIGGLFFPWEMMAAAEKTFLWEINLASNRSFILGSIHFLKKEMYPLPVQLEPAFKRSDILVVEADISSHKMSEHLRLTMQKGMYTGDATLKTSLSKKTYELAKTVLNKNGIDIQFYHRFKPWFLALTISGMELMKLGFDPDFGVDKYFIDRASQVALDSNKSKKEILELEGVEYQINLFDGFTPEENDQFLFFSLQEIAHYPAEIDPMVKAWKKGDVTAMERILKQSMNEFAELTFLYKKLVDSRNHRMTEKIISYLSTTKTYFIVVGAGHLLGDQGILKLLQNRGVIIKQL